MRPFAAFVICAAVLAACSDEVPMVNLGIDDVYYIPRMSKLPLNPALTGSAYRWTVDGVEVNTARDYLFLACEEGSYHLALDIIAAPPDLPALRPRDNLRSKISKK